MVKKGKAKAQRVSLMGKTRKMEGFLEERNMGEKSYCLNHLKHHDQNVVSTSINSQVLACNKHIGTLKRKQMRKNEKYAQLGSKLTRE